MDNEQLAKEKKREKDKKDTIKSVLLCAFGTFMFATLGSLLVFDVFSESAAIEKIIYGSIAAGLVLICISGVLLSCISYYLQYIRPEKHPEIRYSTAEQKRRSEVHKRLPGRDIFDALGKYRRKFLRNRILGISSGILLALLLIILRFSEENISLWVAIVIAIVIVAISCIIAWKKDVTFKTELDLRKIIAEKNIDLLRLNTDFMASTTHKLFDGIALLGMDYLVIYAMRFCSIVDVKEITYAETFYDVQKFDHNTITRYKLRLYMSYNEMITMTMKNESEMELMANELGIRGLKVEEK